MKRLNNFWKNFEKSSGFDINMPNSILEKSCKTIFLTIDFEN
jgi:hypothetical protein